MSLHDYLNPTLTLEERVSALEAALAADEQWNVCACGHHGSSHSPGNWCLVCDCTHFATKRKPNERSRDLTADERDALRRIYDYLAGNGPYVVGDGMVLATIIEGKQ